MISNTLLPYTVAGGREGRREERMDRPRGREGLMAGWMNLGRVGEAWLKGWMEGWTDE